MVKRGKTDVLDGNSCCQAPGQPKKAQAYIPNHKTVAQVGLRIVIIRHAIPQALPADHGVFPFGIGALVVVPIQITDMHP